MGVQAPARRRRHGGDRVTEVQFAGLVVGILAAIVLTVDFIRYLTDGGEHRG